MRIIGLINFYDEKCDWLAATVASMAPFIDHVVAVDGAYIHYPGGKARSPAVQADTIHSTARACGLGVSIHEPQQRWAGGEVEKRAFLFHAGQLVSSDANDWYFVLDADEVVTDSGVDVRQELATTDLDVATVTHWEHRDHYTPDVRPFVSSMVTQHPIRKFCRAIPGLTVKDSHYTYVTPDGRELWGSGDLEQPLDLGLVMVEHRKKGRDLQRAKDAEGYLERRESLGLEGTGYAG